MIDLNLFKTDAIFVLARSRFMKLREKERKTTKKVFLVLHESYKT